MILDCTIHTLGLLFLGYFAGVSLGLVTGITCGYSEKARYWVDPVIKFLGPIPTSTWIPIMMVIASSLFGGAVFIIALGSWFAVTVASMTGIANVDRDYFEAARTLGASEQQLVFSGCVASRHAFYFTGMYPGYEQFLYSYYDRRDARRKIRTWMVYELEQILGKL